MAVRQLAGALARVCEHGADAAVDVDPGIVPGRSGAVGERVELVLALREAFGQRFEQAGALVKRQGAQRRAAPLARVREHSRKVDPAGGGLRDELAGRGIAQRGVRAPPALPASAHVALQLPRGGGHAMRSMTIAMPCPTPMHMVHSARRPPLRSSWWSAVVARRAPLAPERMAERDGAALRVHVRRIVGDPELAQHGERLGGERLVELDEIDVG